MDAILHTSLGILVGILLAMVYSRKSSDELKNTTTTLVDEIRSLADQIAPTQPEIAQKLSSIITKYAGSGAEPHIFGENNFCPECTTGKIKLSHYGVGPLGVSNAWYACTSCGYKFQSAESSED